ncbi:hypothetical protein AB6D11_02700 [Vibrio splendidus]
MKVNLLLLVSSALPFVVSAEPYYLIEGGFGTAFSYEEPITIERDGQSDIDLGSVSFETKPFDSPPYYMLRLGRWDETDGYEIEFIHHKLYAKGLPDQGVTDFEVTDGYNLLYFNKSYLIGDYVARAGVGVVISHLDMTIDGQNYKDGYQLAGVSLNLAGERRFEISESIMAGLEGKVTYSYADIDYSGGSVTVPNLALHLIASIKYKI